ncbi:MAG: hypothetical protein ABIZ07_06200, partial [Dermatophilaceae bacterium]
GTRQQPAPGQRRRDSGYDEVRVIIEIDGRLGHEGWVAQTVDRHRDLDAATEGWLTIRPTWVDIAVKPCALAIDLGAVFWQRGWRGQVRPCRRAGCAVRLVRSAG